MGKKSDGKFYFIDIDRMSKLCEIKPRVNDETEINVFKFDLFKMCIQRILDDNYSDNELSSLTSDSSMSFDIALNTLIKYKIVKEYDEE